MSKDIPTTDVGRSVPDGLSQQAAEPEVSALRASIPSAFETVTVDEFRRRLKAQEVDNRHMALVCPICGTVQSMASLVAAGATVEQAECQIGFSCEGRITGAGGWPSKPNAARKAVRGCDWSLGGLFRLHKLEVVTEDGEKHPRFTVADQKDAMALASAIEARSDETRSGSAEGESAPEGDAQPLAQSIARKDPS